MAAGRDLYHFSEEPGIAMFEPRTPPHRPEVEPMVWAVDPPHQWTYLFPRDCPRILAWPIATTTTEDRRHWLGEGTDGRGVACMEWEWVERMHSTRLYRYRLPAATFEPLAGEDEPWMFVSRSAVTPSGCEAVGDLVEALREEGIELRVIPSLVGLRGAWATTMHVSGIRLRNARGWEA